MHCIRLTCIWFYFSWGQACTRRKKECTCKDSWCRGLWWKHRRPLGSTQKYNTGEIRRTRKHRRACSSQFHRAGRRDLDGCNRAGRRVESQNCRSDHDAMTSRTGRSSLLIGSPQMSVSLLEHRYLRSLSPSLSAPLSSIQYLLHWPRYRHDSL